MHSKGVKEASVPGLGQRSQGTAQSRNGEEAPSLQGPPNSVRKTGRMEVCRMAQKGVRRAHLKKSEI